MRVVIEGGCVLVDVSSSNRKLDGGEGEMAEDDALRRQRLVGIKETLDDVEEIRPGQAWP